MSASKRNYGIDALRIVSMIMVIILHILGKGGVLETAADLSSRHCAAWGLEIASYCAVNCYAMISGFVGYGKKQKISGIVKLWLQVVFYLFVISVFFKLFFHSSIGRFQAITFLLPVTSKKYWYFTCFFAVFFFIPIFNYIVETLSFKKNTLMIATLVVLFSVLPVVTLGRVMTGDIFNTGDGYSPLWLAILYLIGAYIKKYKINKAFSGKKLFVTYLLCVGITLLSKVSIEYWALHANNVYIFRDILVNYTSPTILLCGIALVLLFSKLQTGERTIRVISFFSTVTFGVYIIHEHPNVREFIYPRLGFITTANAALMILYVIGAALSVWLVCSLIDKVREWLFKLIRVNDFSSYIEKQIRNASNRFISHCSIFLNRDNQ